MLYSSSFAQSQNKALEIYSITEYIDGYVIKAIDTSKSDTLSIISAKEKIANKHKFEKMVVGRTYNFEYEDYVNKMAAIPTKGFVVRIKSTIVWRDSDENKNRPFFSKNTKGLWIRR
jgi:hypothetical protein